MFPLIESIACVDGVLLNLSYHQHRVERSIRLLTGHRTDINLSKVKPPYGLAGKHKCRILYNNEGVQEITFTPYKKREIRKLKIIRNNDIHYEVKSANRKKIDMLASGLKRNEDMILVKSGLVTDSWYANLAFYDGKHWFTPSTPLLEGTKRNYLIDQGVLIDTRIREEDIFAFEKVSLINAMLDLDEVSILINKVIA